MGLIPTSIMKIAPKGKGIIQNSVTGIGTAAVLQTVDNFIGSPLQRFGITLPFLGIRVSLIDGINYMIHAGGLKIKKNGYEFPSRLEYLRLLELLYYYRLH